MNRLPLWAFFVFDLLVISTLLVGDEETNKTTLDWLWRYSCLPAAYLLACVALGCLILTLFSRFPTRWCWSSWPSIWFGFCREWQPLSSSVHSVGGLVGSADDT